MLTIISRISVVSIHLILSLSITLTATRIHAADGSNGPGIDNTARPAGTYLKFMPLGGRMVTFHRGYLYIMGQGKTTLWDVSDATDPKLISSENYGDNGHRWWKLDTDVFWREYSTPEIANSGYHFIDMSDMLDLKPWTDPSIPVPIEEAGELLLKWQFLETFPTGTNGGNVHDIRYDNPNENPDAITAVFDTQKGVEGTLRFRIGNLLFTTTGTGIAVLDIGDPLNIKYLDSYVDPGFQQYTTTYHVWRDKIIFLNGTDGNFNNNNMSMLDFSDPTDLKPYIWPNGRSGLTTTEMSAGRYMYFQDEFAFAGHTNLAVKINMETGEIVQEFISPGWPETYLDYQWLPMGPVVVGTGSNGGDGRSFFYQHQDGPDLRGPEIGFHSPAENSTNNPISSVIGVSIAEVIDERTATDNTIQVRAIGSGTPIEGYVTWNSYHVLNFTPKTFLEPNTTYEVRFIENGLKDISGNGIADTRFYFSTGNDIDINSSPTLQNISVIKENEDRPIIVGSIVNFEASAIDAENDPLEFRWDFGEGNSPWNSNIGASYTFNQAGVYTINVQVRDNKGGISGSSRSVVVIEDMGDSTPLSSSAMTLDLKRKRLYVANPDNASVAVIDSDSLVKLSEWSTCPGPSSLTLAQNSELWISCRDADVIEIWNTNTEQKSDAIKLDYGSQPISILASKSGETVYTGLSAKGELLAFNTNTRVIKQRLKLGINLRALAINGQTDTLFATQFISKNEGRVWQVKLDDLSLTHNYSLPNDTSTPDAGNRASGLPNYLRSIAIHPNSGKALVVGKKDNTDRGIFFGNEPLSFEFTSRSNISTLNINTHQEILDKRFDIDNHAQPSSVIYSPYGTHAFITMQGNNRLIVLNPENGAELARADTGLAPQDVLIDPISHRVFVKNFLSRSVSVFDAKSLLLNGGDQLQPLANISSVANEQLAPEVLEGKKIFYNAADPRMTLEGYLSCATCHDDAGHDGRVWDFTTRGEGLRNTIALTGRAGTAHGRMHWSANFDEIHDFEHDIRGAFAGYGFMSNADFSATSPSLGASKAGYSQALDALAAYHASLTHFAPSPYRQADGNLTNDAQKGRVLFENAGCQSCHNGDAFSDSVSGTMHDVGTINTSSGKRLGANLLGIDTPTLRDLWSTAPYLHHGEFETLEDLLNSENTENNAHGFGQFNTQEKTELAAYLKQIDGSDVGFPSLPPQLSLLGVSTGETIKGESFSLSIGTRLSHISELRYYANNVLIGSNDTAPYSIDWTPAMSGPYTLQAQAVYKGGQTKTLSHEIAIVVAPSGDCTIRYNIIDNWDSGYRVDLEVINESSHAVNGVKVHWQKGNNDTFASGWNGNFDSSNGLITISNPSGVWNGDLTENGGSALFGFQMTMPNGTNPSTPEKIYLNDEECVVE